MCRSRKKSIFIDQLIAPHRIHFQDDETQTAIPLKLNQYIKERFNLSQQQAIRSITAATSKEFVCGRMGGGGGGRGVY
jgi:hypothetical protein